MMQSNSRRFGLLGKLVLAIVAAGTIPIVVGLAVAYIKGNSELQEVIGGSFQALAEDSASKVDAEIQRIVAADRLLARQAATDSSVRNALLSSSRDSVQIDWPAVRKAKDGKWVLRSSSVTGPAGGSVGSREKATVKVSGLRLGGETQRYLFRISILIQDQQSDTTIGWLHRDYDVKNLFDPLLYPVRFGETGHVMLIDNLGAIVSCPLLLTGSRIVDQPLVTRVATDKAGWITAENDGHGGQKFSIIGHAPLAGVNPFLQPGVSWHMFVWQDSREIFAPARSLLIGVALAGLLAIGLLGTLGYYASSRIVNPIRRLRQEASHIANGDLNRTLDIKTGDEIEELAGQFNEMRIQLRQLIGTLEEKVEDRTRELKEAQAEKDRVMQQLIQTEKVAAIGTMASGIGHEINNPLYAILGMAEAIRDEKDITQCNEYGGDIVKHSKHIAEIVKNLSGYIRPASKLDLEQVDVNEKLSGAVSMAERSLLSDRVEIRKEFSSVPKISAKPEEIQQAFFNVIRNGMQAMNEKGTLEITSTREGDQVRVRIRDTGVGIPAEHLGKVYDPFFTTKGPDEGEGLGLYIVQQIVKKYEGTISLESEKGKGTLVTIKFPAREQN
ncbi:MAG: ATP-binding protein [Acidiferrobacterales bacterium]